MNTIKNSIILTVNGLALMLYGYYNDYLMQYFNVESTTSKVIIVIGLLLAIIPMIIKVDVFERFDSLEKHFLIFFTEKHYKKSSIQEISIFGLIPITTKELSTESSINLFPNSEVIGESLELISCFIPVLNSWSSLFINLIRFYKALI